MNDEDVPSLANATDGRNSKLEAVLNFIELHEKNILIFTMSYLCCLHVNFFHGCMFLVLLCGILLPGRILHGVIIKTISVTMGVLILSKMLYQTTLFQHKTIFTCQSPNPKADFLSFIFVNRDWLGFGDSVYSDLNGYYGVLCITTILKAIHVRQKMRRIDAGVTSATTQQLFPEVTRQEADKNVSNILKYLINYGFYKFGFEISAIYLTCIIGFRKDILAILYGIPLIAFLVVNRSTASKLWGIFIVFVSICLLFEYISVLGYFPSLCMAISDFQWDNSKLRSTITHWLFITHSSIKVSRQTLFADTIMLAIIRRQYTVFLQENITTFSSFAGSNLPLNKDTDEHIHDHTTFSRPWLDHMKVLVFNGLYWLTMLLALVNGTSNGDVLSLGYLWAAFTLLWEGNDLYLWTTPSLVKRWNVFLAYSIFVIIAKSTALVYACDLKEHAFLPSTIQIFTIMKCGATYQPYAEVLGFACLLLQKRFFQSYYFLHHSFDAKASKVQESEGGELIHELNRRKLADEVRKKDQTLKKLKKDMAAIIAMHREADSNSELIEPKSHEIAVRMGNSSVFEVTLKAHGRGGKRRRTSSTAGRLWTAIKEMRTGPKQDEKQSDDEDENGWDYEAFSKSKKTTSKRTTKRRSSSLVVWGRKWYFKLLLFWEAIKSILIDIIPRLNGLSYNHRFVAWILNKEKAELKAKRSEGDEDCINALTPSATVDITTKFKEFEESVQNDERHIVILFFEALWYLFLTHADSACYMAVFLHQMLVPTIMSLPLPLMALLWGSLTKRGPTPTFWTTQSAYVEAAMIMKVLTKSFHFAGLGRATIIGIEENDQNIMIDIALLLIFFSHKIRLKSRGLWHTSNVGMAFTAVKWKNKKNGKCCSTRFKQSMNQHLENIKDFVAQLQVPPSKIPVDVYKYIFICDFLNLLFVFFAYDAFTPNDTPTSSKFLMESNIPASYVGTLLLVFIVLLLKRALYLRRATLAKVVLHISLVLLMHGWLFIGLPILTERSFAYQLWTNLLYFTNCISFLLFAYEIRNGSPPQIYENFITKNYNYINYYGFKVLQFIPFFTAFKMVLDWMNTKTSMTIMEWLRMERMYSVIFECKCARRIEKDYPTLRGIGIREVTKISTGLLIVLLLVVICWSPMILFTIFKSVSKSTPPSEARLSLRLNYYDSLFTHEFSPNEIKNFTEKQYQELRADLKEKIPESRELFARYDREEVYSCTLSQYSDSNWQIAPGRLKQLQNLLKSDKELFFALDWEFKRLENGVTAEESRVEGGKMMLNRNTRNRLANAIDKQTSTYFNISVNNIFQITKEGRAVAFEPSEGSVITAISLKFDNPRIWWEVEGGCVLNFTAASNRHQQERNKQCQPVKIFIFSSKRVPLAFDFISNKGVLGLYISVVFVTWTILRRLLLSMHSEIMFYEMNNVDPVLQLCNDIYLARANHELALEEDLYAKLIFLFKSPDTMTKWTRLRQEDLQ